MLYSQQSELIEAVREESESLQELEQEISYYHGLIERRKEISKLYRENNIKSGWRRMFIPYLVPTVVILLTWIATGNYLIKFQ